jgi:hypothetical protein
MGYYVRLLSPSEKRVSLLELLQQVETLKLVSGTNNEWEEVLVSGPSENPIAHLRNIAVSSEDGRQILEKLRDGIFASQPEKARAWVKARLDAAKTIYSFQLLTENLTTDMEWRVLGHLQNHLKDALGGIIQSDNEGYFNENGDYILWQMYSGAGGTIPAAIFDDNGKWQAFQLKLDDLKAVESFKRGDPPRKTLFDIFFRK